MRISSSLLKKLYWLVMGLMVICIAMSIYTLLHPHFKNKMYTAISIITPLLVVVYLYAVKRRRNKLLKKIHEYREKSFSKN